MANAYIKIGDRCIIIGGLSEDLGKIVTVIGNMSSHIYNGLIWESNYDVIIRSEGSMLTTRADQISVSGNSIWGRVMVKPFYTGYLRKLPDVPAEEDERELLVVRP